MVHFSFGLLVALPLVCRKMKRQPQDLSSVSKMSVFWASSLQGNRELTLFLPFSIFIWLLDQSSHLLSVTRRRQTSCTPKITIVFLKTHKTASTSLQNILMRYGVKDGALFVSPPEANILSTNRSSHVNPTWSVTGSRAS